MVLCSKSEDSIRFGFIETELNAADEPNLSMFTCIKLIYPGCPCDFKYSIPFGDLETEVNVRWRIQIFSVQ